MTTATPITRVARCSCGTEAPTSPDLAFLTTAEEHAQDRCKHCGYAECAHAPEVRNRPHLRRTVGDGHAFAPAAPRSFDTFYCGCRGWD